MSLGKLKVTGNIGRVSNVETSKKGNPFITLSICYQNKTDTTPAKWMRVAVVGTEDIATVQQTAPVGALVEVTGTPYVDTYIEQGTRKQLPVLSVYMSSIKVKAMPKPKEADDVMPHIPTPEELAAAVEPVVTEPVAEQPKRKTRKQTPVLEGATPI